MKNYVIIGAGRFGESLALTLSDLGNEVIVIDRDEEVVNKIAPFVTHAVCADIMNTGVYEELGLANVDTAIVAMGSNLEASVLSTLSLKELGVKHVVCKVRTALHANVLKRLGADEVIIPELDMGRKLAYNLESNNVVDFFNLAGDYSIIEMYAPKTWVGSSIMDVDVRVKYGVNILGIIKLNGDFIGNPEPNYQMQEKDKLVLLGTAEQFSVIKELRNNEE
ncbi:MAG: TrkA family potassium uptake protein [Tissierellia bacterium]|nr:TrkA family potassium uptake protein [Tissierellia bacterium]